jgi:hypothetical protein
MDITPEALEDEFTLPTAATRLDFLSRRDSGDTALNTVVDDGDDWSAIKATTTSLDVPEALEVLALGEVIFRKAHGSRLIGLRAALRDGADWEQIAAALDRSPAEAWETYLSLVDDSLEGEAAEAAREMAGSRPR